MRGTPARLGVVLTWVQWDWTFLATCALIWTTGGPFSSAAPFQNRRQSFILGLMFRWIRVKRVALHEALQAPLPMFSPQMEVRPRFIFIFSSHPKYSEVTNKHIRNMDRSNWFISVKTRTRLVLVTCVREAFTAEQVCFENVRQCLNQMGVNFRFWHFHTFSR